MNDESPQGPFDAFDSNPIFIPVTRLALIAALAALPATAQDSTVPAGTEGSVPDVTVEGGVGDGLVEEAAVALAPLDAWLADPSQRFEASEVNLADFQWRARPVVVFADTPADPAFQRQVELLAARLDDLIERDVVVILDADPSSRSELREQLRPRGFMLAIIGKDGGVKLRKPFPWDVREITRSIDKMPMRQQEIRDRRDRGT